MRGIFIALLLLFVPVLLFAATIHVPADQPTIQAGINAAGAGDTVFVACGTYTWTSEGTGYDYWQGPSLISMKSGVYLSSATGEANCVTIDAQDQGRIFYCDGVDGYASIVGFSLIGGTAENYGGGMFIDYSNLVLENCHFVANGSGLLGSSIWLGHSNPTLRNCAFAASIGGNTIHLDDSDAKFTNCSFVGNQSPNTIIRCWYSAPEFDNCVISDNSCPETVITCESSQPILACSDIYGNSGGDWFGCVADQLGINGNISLDPLFCDPDLGDFSLRNDSPCAPENNDCGVLMGAWPMGCSTGVESRSWSHLKTMY